MAIYPTERDQVRKQASFDISLAVELPVMLHQNDQN